MTELCNNCWPEVGKTSGRAIRLEDAAEQASAAMLEYALSHGKADC